MRTVFTNMPNRMRSHMPGQTLHNTPGHLPGRMRSRILGGAIAVAVLIALPPAARAGNDIGVVVAGESWMQPQLTAQFESWLTQHGHAVAQLPPDALDSLKQCFVTRDLLCARGVIDHLSKPISVIYAGVDAKNANSTTPDVTLTAWLLDKGREAIAERQTCPRCTDQSLRIIADETLKKLLGAADLGHVKLKSAPPGATINIDHQPEPVGVAPLDLDLTPGKHTIEMTKPGLKPASRDIFVTSNKSDLVVMTLTAEGTDEQSNGESALSRWTPRVLTVTGGVALLVGGGLIVFSPKETAKEHYYYSTVKPGIGVAIGGAVIGGIGAWLWLRSSGDVSTPVATLTRDSAYVGWLGRF